MPSSARRYKGKYKIEIAAEAFEILGPHATVPQVDAHFRKYGLDFCERSMYQAAKRRAHGRPVMPRRKYPRVSDDKKDLVALLGRTKQLAADVGGYDQLMELIRLLKS